MSTMPDNRKSNVSTSWGDSGWLQDGAAVFQKEEPEPETQPTTTETDDQQAEVKAEAATETKQCVQ